MRFFECVPNFSEGRDPKVIAAVVDAARAVPGVRVLDVESNADHNRSVLSLVGEGEALKEAAFQATRKAAELIDLTKHKGEHPRMGAMDVIPFIPMGEATMEEAVSLATALGERVASQLSIPVYLYGKAARIPERMDLAYVRRGEFEGIRSSIGQDATRKPDLGEARVHPTAGAVAIGARPVLIAYNIYLNTPDVGVAKAIARAIRARDGGLAEVKALGFEITERHQAQVSINMTDYRRTPLHRVFEMVRSEADRFGVSLGESEVVGLVPEDALLDAAEHYLRLNHFDRQTILERKLQGVPSNFLESTSLATYLNALAARTPTPGGGSASALVGALGVALGEMVTRFAGPANNLPPEAVEPLAKLADLRSKLQQGVEEDSKAYDGVRQAFRLRKSLPQDEGAQITYRSALQHAAEVPLSIAQHSFSAYSLLKQREGSVKAIMRSDYDAALGFLRASIAGAVENVRINIVTMKEESMATGPLEEALRALELP
jgi:glutamate formiminotransferase/formiminotetrahydrofolate cyclodeaminase